MASKATIPHTNLACGPLCQKLKVSGVVAAMKRPAKKPPAKGVTKKPASSSKSVNINEAITKMKRGVSKVDLGQEEPEEEVESADLVSGEDEAEGGAGRDKATSQRYLKLRDSLPAHVVDLVDKQSRLSCNPRAFKTQCINRLFKRNKKTGKLELNLEDQMFTEHRDVYSKKFARETDHAYPEAIMKGMYFQNDEGAFTRAKDAGDIKAVDIGCLTGGFHLGRVRFL